jgi:hypothetical protein
MSLYGIVDAVNLRLLALLLAAAVHGRVTATFFRRFADRAALRTITNQIIAHVLEFRLFTDEPALIWKAQKDLFRANARLLRHLAAPTLLSAAILAAAWMPMNRYLDKTSLQPGQVTIARADSADPALDLIAPFGAVVESPALHIPSEGATYWRIRALSPVSGDFRTVPVRHSLRIDYPAARYLGLPWLILFALVSGFRTLLALR